ncbi:MAG TPA: hypothetical protein ENI27_04505 [bacterium]|nr:hypothetical protein [bacterium]
MKNRRKEGLWKRFTRSLKDLKGEMEKNSVANNVPPPQGCCHLPDEEIERKRANYKALARQRH